MAIHRRHGQQTPEQDVHLEVREPERIRGILGPLTLGGTSVTMHLQVDDADAVIRRAAEAGAEIENEPEDQFYGERSGWLRDPSGHRWNVGHFLDEVTPEEMQRRFTAMMTGTDTLTRPTRLQVPDRVPPAHPKRLEPHILIAVLCAGGSRPTTCSLQVNRPGVPQFFL